MSKKVQKEKTEENPTVSNDNKVVVKRNIKDCVFTDLFSNKKYLLELYLALHPEDTGITEDDLTDITIENVLVNDLYNDLGFRVGDRLIILVEAQSTWSPNILIRSLLYVATTYQNYINERNLDVYSSKKISIPKPELYVIYTGEHKERPRELQLSKEFFKDAEDISLDVKVKMIYGDNEDDIIGQYVIFTKVYDEQRKLYGRTRKAIEETIRICKERNVLKEYLESREGEVVTMMMTLFDEEQIARNHDAAIRREEREKTTEQAIANIITVYRQIDGSIDAAIQNIMKMYGYSEKDATEIVQKYWDEVPVTININMPKND
ncbi:MAG: hypothetical protein MR409_01570 [Lachnospiraceae bacterium]|nr:hypothetical protein [Lachnospiraceae bacterium]